ncbi:hypothetical protein UFOVP340_38 [uncultured Caudovirales phage]|uniref:Glycine-rich domain-containing protein n=1 Tax=uncultured Caudovirales phage TaxID=2100421 RepID=A0A6J5LZU1_9CAUD|nr:hypothetical protein UFOVP340_38 [uncultured Caudovirales phage]
MAQIQSPETYVDGQQVTAARLNNQTNGAILLPGAVTDQPAIDAGTVATADGLIIHDASASALRKATAGDLLGSGVPIVASTIGGLAGADIVINAPAGREVDVVGPFQVIGNSTMTGNSTVTGGLTVGGTAAFNATTAIKIPVGTTGERPGTPVAGQLRYNSTLDQAEVYSGTEWKAVGGSPFDASGGTVTTVDGFRIHTFTTSGTFTPALNRDGKIEYLIVGAGGAGVLWEKGGGGGGGNVLTGFLNIPKNQAPMPVVVGVGSAGHGTASSFASITANGGRTSTGSGWDGGESGSGIAGTVGNNDGGAGGSGSRTAQWYRAYGLTRHAGMGGLGVGSYISGTYKEYGGGGSGATGGVMTPNLYGGGGAYGAPEANSGGGGSGGSGHWGANGVVIIRYRVS